MREHDDSTGCWCEPAIIPVGERRVVVHAEPDGSQPPLSVLAEAIRLAQED